MTQYAALDLAFIQKLTKVSLQLADADKCW